MARPGSDGKAAERELVCRKKPEPKQSANTSHFATQAGTVLTSPYPSVDGLTRGFVRLR